MRPALVLATMALVALLASPSITHAQTGGTEQPRPFVIWLSHVAEDELAVLEPLTAYVQDVECGTQSIEKGVPAVVVGRADTPDTCRAEGASITLVGAHGEPLAEQPVFADTDTRRGGQHILESLALADTGPPSPAEAGHGADRTDEDSLALWIALTVGTVTALLLGRCLADRFHNEG